VSRQSHEALKTKYAIQSLEPISKRINTSTTQRSLAHSHVCSQAIHPYSGRRAIVSGGPAKGCDLPVSRANLGQPVQQKGFQSHPNICRTAISGNFIQKLMSLSSPELGKRHPAVNYLAQRRA